MWTRNAADALNKACVSHENFEWTYSMLEEMIFTSDGGEVIALTGPSRSGKTKLTQEVLGNLYGTLDSFESCMPWAYVSAENCSVQGEFSTKAFTVRALTAICHPIFGLSPRSRLEDLPHGRLHKTTEGELREALQCGLECRRTKVLVIDEAQHIMHSRRRFADACAILDSWKCMAALCNLILVVTGAYELLPVLESSPHMIGRTGVVHLGRYQQTANDIECFDSVLRGFTRVLRPFQADINLSKWNEELFTESLGCVGLLNKSLRTALARAGSKKAGKLELEHILATRRPAAFRGKLLRSIQAGEKKLSTIECPIVSPPERRSTKRRRSSLGQPNPHRDVVEA